MNCFNFMRPLGALLVLAFLLLSSIANACTGACSLTGQMQYCSGTMRYCNGTTWTDLPSDDVGGSCSIPGQLSYASNALRFCSATALKYPYCQSSPTTNGTCTIGGQVSYDTGNSRYQFCNGTNWLAMIGCGLDSGAGTDVLPGPVCFAPNSSNIVDMAQSTGAIYLAGILVRAGTCAAGSVISLATGTVPFTSATVSGSTGNVVNTAISDGSGGYYIAGTFTSVGGVPRTNIARINADGSLNISFNASVNGLVWDMVLVGSTLYLGGEFTSINGEARSRIGSVHATTGNNLPWNPGANNTVRSFQVSGTNLYVSGLFTTIAGNSRSRLALFNTTTGSIEITSFPTFNNAINAMSLAGTTLYLGGVFTVVGGNTRHFVASINTDSEALTGWDPGSIVPSTNGAGVGINSIAVSGSAVYLGGLFNNMGGISRTSASAVDSVTGADLGINIQTNSLVNKLVLSGNTLYMGGNFSSVAGQPRNRVASVIMDNASSPTSALLSSFSPVDTVTRTIALSGATMYLGGDPGPIGTVIRTRLAAINKNTGALTSWAPETSGSANALNSIVVNNGVVYVSGNFTTLAGAARTRIGSVTANTGVVTSWNPTANSVANSLLTSDNMLYLGGIFFGTTLGSPSSRNRLASFDLAPIIPTLTSWNPNSTASIVNRITLRGSVLYAALTNSGGNVGGAPRNAFAAVGTIDGLATIWNPNANGAGTAIAVDDNVAIVGGDFTTIGGRSRNRLAALNLTTGDAMNPWNENIGGNGTINDLLLTGSMFYASGTFTSIGSGSQSLLARLNTSNGNLVATWAPTIVGTDVRKMLISTTDSNIMYIAGTFSSIGNQRRTHFGAVDLTTGDVR